MKTKIIEIIFIITILSLTYFSSVFAEYNLAIKNENTTSSINTNTNLNEKYESPKNLTFQYKLYDFLIIHPKGWDYLFDPLIEHKEKNGIKTIAISLDEIYNGLYFEVKGRDDAEKIKYFIKNAIENWNIKYVLLIGGKYSLNDEWLIPVRYAWLNDRSSSWEYERCFISDLYYADIYDVNGNFSSWDSNNNNYFGEYDHEINGVKFSDYVDLYPDVYIGRLAVRNKLELRLVINNIILYENNPNLKINNMILCGGDLYLKDPWNISEGEFILDHIDEQMFDFNTRKIYASQGLDFKKINTAINKGAGFVVFEGAGNPNLWGTHAKDDEKWIYYRKINILQLKNDYKPIILTSGARLGCFNKSKECFNWFFVSKGKAIASIGSTGLCWIGHGTNVTEMFLGNLHLRLCKKMSEKGFLGDAWGEAIKEYLANFSWTGVTNAFHIKAVEELELFGDPTLKIGGYNEYVFEKSNISSILNVNEERNFLQDRIDKDFYLNVIEKFESPEDPALQVGDILHVGGDGNGNYSTIQIAIDNANNGDIIIVHQGIYYENLLVDKQLKIIGENAKIKTNEILLICSYITIEGFIIEGYDKNNCINCIGNYIIIKNNTIKRFDISIFVSGDNCKIFDNSINNSYYGVYLNKNKKTDIKNNVIKNNWYGIWCENTYNTYISFNDFSYNEWYAVWMEGINGEINRNNFEYNWYSIYLYNSLNFSLNNNTMFNNMHGSQFVNSSYNIFCFNNVYNNQHFGIFFGWRSKINDIFSNNFIDNYNNVRDDGYNTWDKNYWSDYIGLKIKILFLLDFPYKINQFSCDWHPAQKPYEIE